MSEIDLHPVKVETFDVHGRINIDPKGTTRPVDEFSFRQGALYMGRPADHREFDYLESWLLPAHNLRISRFHFREGIKMGQDFYVDIALIDRGGSPEKPVWTTRDLYIDLVGHSDGTWDLLDLDELGAALQSGYLTESEAATALITTQNAIDHIKAHGFDAWVDSLGVDLTWPVWDARH